jgi:cobalt-zinc-cadmium efflux system outer membrane protein
LDQSWDDPIYRSLRDSHAEADTRVAENPSATAGGQTPGIESLDQLSVDDAIRIAIANNPRLRRAGYRVDAAAGRVTQAGLYPNPSFMFDVEALGSDAGGGGETTYRFEQEIVLGGKLRRAREVADADRMTARAQFVAEEFAVASRVTRSYFAAVAARERLALRRDLIDLADQLLRAATAQVDAGAATEPDRLRAEVVREQAQIELDAARLQLKAARRKLATAMGLDGTVDLPLVTEVHLVPRFPTQEELAASVLDANSRLAIARIAVERARRAHRLAKAEAIPNLVASAGPRYSDPESETTLDLGIGVEIPLFDRNQGAIHAAVAERLSAAAELRSVQIELLAEVSEAWSAYEAARIATTRYREQLLPKADRTLDLTRQAYERGKADYLRLLDAQQVVVESRIAQLDSLQSLHEAAAMLRELAQTNAPWRDSRSAELNSEETNP